MTHSHKDFNFSGLSEAERILLAHQLLEGVSERAIDELCPLTQEQLEEIDRRCAAIDSGEVECIPWDDALRVLRERK